MHPPVSSGERGLYRPEWRSAAYTGRALTHRPRVSGQPSTAATVAAWVSCPDPGPVSPESSGVGRGQPLTSTPSTIWATSSQSTAAQNRARQHLPELEECRRQEVFEAAPPPPA